MAEIEENRIVDNEFDILFDDGGDEDLTTPKQASLGEREERLVLATSHNETHFFHQKRTSANKYLVEEDSEQTLQTLQQTSTFFSRGSGTSPDPNASSTSKAPSQPSPRNVEEFHGAVSGPYPEKETPNPPNDAITDPNQEQEAINNLLRARAEWDSLEALKQESGDSPKRSPLISFNETLAHFQRKDMGQYLKQIKPTVHRTGFGLLRHFFFGPPSLNRNLHEERNLVFAIALCPFDNSEAVHQRVLQTIYKKLTGSSFDCPRFGTHWEQIGFQGNDPATDLRGTGFWGLMNLLSFVMEPATVALARDIHRLSQDEVQNFPFCLMSINVTRICIQALREECLSKECNKRKQVIAVMNHFYLATFYHLYQIWKKEHKSIADSGFVIKDVENYSKKNPREVLRRFELYLSKKGTAEGAAAAGEAATSLQSSTKEGAGQLRLSQLDKLENLSAN